VLEPSAPQRFYLSARAAAGILRRASKRGRTLPTELGQALSSLARGEASGTTTPTTISSSDTEASPTELPAPEPLEPLWDTTDTPSAHKTPTADISRSQPVLLTMHEEKPGGGKGPLVSRNVSLNLATAPTQTLFHGPSVRRLTPVETERLMGWPDGHTIAHNWKKGR
jgi:site-specific DNA-cytosine methylase